MRNVVHLTIFLFLPTVLWSQSTTPQPPTNLPQECACTASNIWLDIVVVVDTSSSMTQQGLTIVEGFLSGIFSSLSVSQLTGRFTRLAIVGFAKNATVFNYLTDINGTDQALTAIRDIKYSGGDQVNLMPAFQTVDEVISISDKRPDVKNLILVITTACTDDPTTIANQVKARGDVIVSVGYGQSDELPPPLLNFASPGFNFTNRDANLTEELLAAFCDINCFCPNSRWKQFVDMTNKKFGECLYPGDVPTTWEQAQLTCQANLHYLVDELSAQKHYFVKSLAINQGILPMVYWIGLAKKNGNWSWDRGINGSLPLASNDYTNWAPGNPDNLNNCTGEQRITGFTLQWKTMACTTTLASDFHNYFCQTRACDTDNYCLETGADTTISTGTGPTTTAITSTSTVSTTAAITTTTISSTSTVTAPTTPGVPTTTRNPNCNVSQLAIDLVLMADDSLAAGQSHFNNQLTVMKALVANYSISSSSMQVVADAYSEIDDPSDANFIGNLKTYNTKSKVLQMFDALSGLYTGNPFQYANYLKAVLDGQLTNISGLRPSAQHAVAIFSTAATSQDDLTKAMTWTTQMRNQRVAVWGVSFGTLAASNQLGQLTGSSNCVFNATGGIVDQDAIINWIQRQSCLNTIC